MAIPTVYRWDDASAPQITRGSISELEALFTACLINGYGAKLPPISGTNKWTIPFSNATGFILQQGGTQTRKCGIKIYDINAAAGYCNVTAAVSWSDINTPTTIFAGGTAADRVGTGFGALVAYNIPWVIFATERTIYAHFGHNAVGPNTPILFDSVADVDMNNDHWIFGDYKPVSVSHTFNQILTFSATTTVDENFTLDNSSLAQGRKFLSGTLDNNDLSIASDVMYSRSNALNDINIADYVTFNVTGFMSRYRDGNLFVEDAVIVALNTIMGTFPGMVYPTAMRPFATMGGIHSFSFSGINYYIFGTGHGGQYFIHDGEWGVD